MNVYVMFKVCVSIGWRYFLEGCKISVVFVLFDHGKFGTLFIFFGIVFI